MSEVRLDLDVLVPSAVESITVRIPPVYETAPGILLDRKRYVLALVDWRGSIVLRRTRLSEEDAIDLAAWLPSRTPFGTCGDCRRGFPSRKLTKSRAGDEPSTVLRCEPCLASSFASVVAKPVRNLDD